MRISIPILLSIVQVGFTNNAVAFSTETNICIHNKTNQSHYIQTADITNYDWDGVSRPDHNFNNITIQSGEKICRREETNNHASPKFTFLIDGNPTEMAFKATSRSFKSKGVGFNYYDYRWGANTNTSNPTTLHGEKTIYFQPSDWWVGYKCAGEQCTTFELR